MAVRSLLVIAFVTACGSSSGAGGGGDEPDAATTSDCKRGVAYGYHSMADMQALSPGISWWYNWALLPDEGVRDMVASLGVEFVPMVWGQNSLGDADAAVAAGEKFLLAFNEPNFGSQANITAQQAAALWPQVEAIAEAHHLAIVSPALNYCGGSCNATSPFTWFDDFFAACPDCKVDYLAVHWYACTRSALESYIGQMKKYNRPIWLTELACLDQNDKSVPVQKAYMTDALDYLESEPAVFRYAWFSGRFDPQPTVNLLGASGELTELGQQYVTAPGACN
jgi:hypothetical protein